MAGASPSTSATVRFFAALISLGALGLGYWWALFDPRNRTWPDLWSGSRVLYRVD